MSDLEERTLREPRRQALRAGGLAAMLLLHVLLLTPFALYAGNLEEFAVSFPDIFKYYAALAVPLTALLSLLGAALPRSAYRVYSVLLATICCLLWLQGNVLVWDYGLLDGRAIDWYEAPWRGVVDSAVWAVVLVGALAFRRRLEQPIVVLAIVTFALPFADRAVLAIEKASDLSAKSAARPSGDAIEELVRFSSEQNVLQIIMDGFQSDVFKEIIDEDGEGRRLAAALEGFVFFEDNVGAFPYTHMSIPAILSGKLYRNHVPRSRFLEEAIGGTTSVNAALAAGYEVDLAFPPGLSDLYSRSRYTSAYAIPTTSHVGVRAYELDAAARLLDLSLFRLAPHFLKQRVYNDQLWRLRAFQVDSEYEHLEFFAHNRFLLRLRDDMSADRPTPVYKLLHLMLSHNPMVANSDCGYVGQVLETERANVTLQARCSLTSVVALLERMKELDIYDDALIILMADHGAFVAPTGLRSYLDDDGQRLGMHPITVAMAMPVLLIKRPGANGPLEVSLAPSAITDTAATIAAVLGLAPQFAGRSVFDLQPGEQRERLHHGYRWQSSEWTDEFLNPIHEYVIRGPVLDSAAWSWRQDFHPSDAREREQPSD